MKIAKGRKVDDQGLDTIVGNLGPGEQLPREGQGKTRYDGIYQYIEGDVRNRFQKDGSLVLEAHPLDGSPCSKLELVVDHDSWQCRDNSPDRDSKVTLVADVHEVQGDEWKVELRIFDAYNPCKWMEEFGTKHNLGKKPLCQVGLPGTHDSGTYRFDKTKGASTDSGLDSIQNILDRGKVLGKVNEWLLSAIFERLCQCQSLTIREQLEQGIRYVDMRVGYHADSGTFMTCHGVFCVDVEEILEEITSFLQDNPKEIVIVEFKKLYGFQEGQYEALGNMIIKAFGNKLAVRDECPANAPVQKFWNKGYQAVVLYQNQNMCNQSNGRLWPLNYLDSPWPNAGNTTELYSALQKKVANHSKDHFFAVQGILTPDAELIQKELWKGGGDMSIRQVARRCGGKVVDWVEEEWKPTKNLNIVIVDFFEDCNLLPAIINYNQL